MNGCARSGRERRTATLTTVAVVAAVLMFGSGGARADLVTEGWSAEASGGVPGWPGSQAASREEGGGNTFDTISQTVTGQVMGRRYKLDWASASRSAHQRLVALFYDVVAGRVVPGNGSKSCCLTGWPGGFEPRRAPGTAGTVELLGDAAMRAGGGSGGNQLDAVMLDQDAP